MQRNDIVNVLGERIKLNISFAKGFFEIELTRDVSKFSTIVVFSSFIIATIHCILYHGVFNLLNEVGITWL